MRFTTRRAAAATITMSVVVGAVLVAPNAASGATKRQVTVAADVQTMYYGQATPSLSYTVYGLVNGDRLTKQPTCSVPAHVNVGKYPITCAGAGVDTTKYTLAYVPAPLYVGKAPLYIGPNYRQIRYGDAEPAVTYTALGLVGKDALRTAPTCTTEGTHKDAGRYKVTCAGADAGSNYEIRYLDGAYDVAKVALLSGPKPQAIYFGSPEPAFESTTLGLVNGEKLVTEPTCGVAGEHVHAGKYPITCTGAKATSNYTLTTGSSTYTVAANQTALTGDRAAVKRNLLNQPTGAMLRAQLYLVYPYGTVFAGQTVTFTAGSTSLCTAVTDKDGYASCTVGAPAAAAIVKNGSYTATYAGQEKDIFGSSVTVKN